MGRGEVPLDLKEFLLSVEPLEAFVPFVVSLPAVSCLSRGRLVARGPQR